MLGSNLFNTGEFKKPKKISNRIKDAEKFVDWS